MSINQQFRMQKGPAGTLLAGCADWFKDDALGFLETLKRDYGNLVTFRIGLTQCLFVNEPELLQSLLVTNAMHFQKDIAVWNNRRFFGHGLLSSEGDYWKRQRKLAAPAFGPKSIETYSKVMVEMTNKHLAGWSPGQMVDIQREMMEITLAIAVKTLFDYEIGKNEKLERALTDAQKYLADRMKDVFILCTPEWFPIPTNVHLTAAIAEVDEFVYQLIRQRRESGTFGTDLLSSLIAAKDDDGSQMTDKQIRDEVFTLFFAGHETTALTLTYALHLISQHAHVEDKLVDELRRVLDGRTPQMSDYPKLIYTDMVVKEALRLRPPVWAIGREAVRDCRLDDIPVKKGMAIFASQWVMHHDSRYYDEPEEFRPERWTREFSDRLPKFAYFPFGGGPRTCIGNIFATVEATLVLATLLQRFHLSTAPGQKIELDPLVTLRPKHGIKMIVENR